MSTCTSERRLTQCQSFLVLVERSKFVVNEVNGTFQDLHRVPLGLVQVG